MRDPATERLWFSVTMETHDEEGRPFSRPNAAVRHHGGIVAYYGGWGPDYSAEVCARESIEERIAVICGTWNEVYR